MKVLAKGEITKPLTVHAHAFSASARAAIEAAGGTCQSSSTDLATPIRPGPNRRRGVERRDRDGAMRRSPRRRAIAVHRLVRGAPAHGRRSACCSSCTRSS